MPIHNHILERIQNLSERRNEDLIQKWVEEYKRNGHLLVLVGSVVLLCRKVPESHGEYTQAISNYVDVPIEEAEIPDRAYDYHTSIGKRKGRDHDHFFKEAATLKNERFENNWEAAGREAYFRADEKGLGKTSKIIEAIKERL
jgi:hypothetical protein